MGARRLPRLHLTAMQASPTGKQAGPQPKRLGVAVTVGTDVKRPPRPHSTAMQASRTGRLGGQRQRRSGAVPTVAAGVRPAHRLAPLKTAMLDTQTGRRDGQRRRRLGVASMRVKHAHPLHHQQLLALLRTAAQATPTGRLVGCRLRRIGAACTRERVAPVRPSQQNTRSQPTSAVTSSVCGMEEQQRASQRSLAWLVLAWLSLWFGSARSQRALPGGPAARHFAC